MTARAERLPAELTSLQAWVACIADARPLDAIAELLEEAGFIIESAESRHEALADLLERVDRHLHAARLLPMAPEAIDRGRALVSAAKDALARGWLGHGTVVAGRA